MLGSGLRLQVKTATLRNRKTRLQLKNQEKEYTTTAYHLSLGWCQMGRVQTPIRRKRLYSEECDYFIIWGVDESRFWIVPSFVLDNRTCLVLEPKAKPNAQQVADLAKQGVGLKEIAERLGCCEVTAWKRKRETKTPMGAFTSAVRNCEDRWDFLNVKPLDLLEGDRRREDEIAALELMLEAK